MIAIPNKHRTQICFSFSLSTCPSLQTCKWKSAMYNIALFHLANTQVISTGKQLIAIKIVAYYTSRHNITLLFIFGLVTHKVNSMVNNGHLATRCILELCYFKCDIICNRRSGVMNVGNLSRALLPFSWYRPSFIIQLSCIIVLHTGPHQAWHGGKKKYRDGVSSWRVQQPWNR